MTSGIFRSNSTMPILEQLIYQGRTYSLINGVAVRNYLSSGSSLLLSLLDWHPQIVSGPGHGLIDFYRVYYCNRRFKSTAELVEFLLSEFRSLYDDAHVDRINGYGALGPDRNQNSAVDIGILRPILLDFVSQSATNISSRRLFFSLALSYALAAGQELGENLYIVWSAHSQTEKEFSFFLKDFPDALVIHPLRDLPSLAGSRVTGYNYENLETRGDLWTSMCSQMFENKLALKGEYAPFGEIIYPGMDPARAKAIRLEDLHEIPHVVMRSVADWIGIEWNELLLQSTTKGLKWWNRLRSPRVSGPVGKAFAGWNSERINWLDRLRLNVMGSRRRKAWGYSNRDARFYERAVFWMTLLLPSKIEWNSHVDDNRVLSRAVANFDRTDMIGRYLKAKAAEVRFWTETIWNNRIQNIMKPGAYVIEIWPASDNGSELTSSQPVKIASEPQDNVELYLRSHLDEVLKLSRIERVKVALLIAYNRAIVWWGDYIGRRRQILRILKREQSPQYELVQLLRLDIDKSHLARGDLIRK